MPTIHLHEMTTATPEQIVAALTDFGPGRSKIFENSADDELKVHYQGPNHADVTEGGRGTSERLPPRRLVRSQPHRHDHRRLQRLGRRLGPHLHPHAAA